MHVEEQIPSSGEIILLYPIKLGFSGRGFIQERRCLLLEMAGFITSSPRDLLDGINNMEKLEMFQ